MFEKNIKYHMFVYCFITICFSYLFYLSLNYIINSWTFSQSHINYSEGFVKRGLFGTIILILEKTLNIKTNKSFSIFFIIIYLLNIILFFLIIFKYRANKPLFLFFSLSPTLIMFSFNDLGGYQRFDAISIFLMMGHSFVACKYREKKINFFKYLKIFDIIIYPLILISLLVHEIQAWSIFFHLILNYMILLENKHDLKNFYIKIIIFFLFIIFIFLYPVSKSNVENMIESINNKHIWLDAIRIAARTEGNLEIINDELRNNLFNFYNLKINLFFTIMSIVPINLLIFFYKKNNVIKLPKNSLLYLNLSIIPFFSYFAIGDTGRWINLMSFTAFSYFAQFPYIVKKNNKNFLSTNKSIIIIIILIYCFFTRLPHCCNLEKKGLTIWGGIANKIDVAINIYIKKNKNKFYDFNSRFTKQNEKK